MKAPESDLAKDSRLNLQTGATSFESCRWMILDANDGVVVEAKHNSGK